MLFFQSFVEAGAKPTKEAVDGLLRAVALAPRDDEVRMLAVRQMLTDDRAAEARQLFAPIAVAPHATEKARERNAKVMAAIASGDISETRSADVYLQFSKLRVKDRSRIKTFCNQELKRLTAKPQVTLIGIGMEVRQCYATGDSKRAQADEAMGRHLLLSGILPVIPFFCNQSNPSIIRRYKERSIWIVKEGRDSYELIHTLSGYDMLDFMQRNRNDFRKPVVDLLRSMQA